VKSVNENRAKNQTDAWWRHKTILQTLSHWFCRHLLVLFVSFKAGDQTYHEIFTGFLLDYRKHLLWITAGHVVDGIGKILSDPRFRVLRMRWADAYPIAGAESIPVNHQALHLFSAAKGQVDLGFARVTGLEEVNIRKNNRVEIMTDQVWRNLHLARPEGYCLLGYPEEWSEVKEHSLGNGRVSGTGRAKVACLPIRRIEYRGPHPTRKFWNDPQAFYGEILSFTGGSDDQPQSASGMSGGPLFSLEREADGKIRYRLFGIQRSEYSSEKLIRVEPIHRVIAIINSELPIR